VRSQPYHASRPSPVRAETRKIVVLGLTRRALAGADAVPSILPPSPRLYGFLRDAHSAVAYLLFATFLAHLTSVLFHAWVVHDGILQRMAPWRPRAARVERAPLPAERGE